MGGAGWSSSLYSGVFEQELIASTNTNKKRASKDLP